MGRVPTNAEDPIAEIGAGEDCRYARRMTENSTTELKAALAAANDKLEKAVRALAPKHVGGEMEAFEAAFQTLMAAERKLANAERRPYAIPCDCPIKWDIGAPLPTLLQSDQKTLLFFLLPDANDHIGKIDFDWCWSTSFGAPSDETFEGHPLHGSGFEPYNAMEVVGSSWISELRKIDSVHRSHDPTAYGSAKHFIFPFHDTTFECVARSFTVSRVQGKLSDAVKSAVNDLY